MNIIVLIPAYNEARTIGSLIVALRKKNLPVVVVDDGSQDHTNVYSTDAGAFVLRHEKNKGKGHSLKTGFGYALMQGFDGVIIMDGDGQHDAADIDQFLNFPELSRAVVINGNRMDKAHNMPAVRYITNRFMSAMISFVCKQSVPDTQCGFRFIGADVLKELRLTSGDFEIETEILIKASKKGFKIYSVPIQTIYGEEKSRIHPVKDTVRFIIYIIKEIFFHKD